MNAISGTQFFEGVGKHAGMIIAKTAQGLAPVLVRAVMDGAKVLAREILVCPDPNNINNYLSKDGFSLATMADVKPTKPAPKPAEK